MGDSPEAAGDPIQSVSHVVPGGGPCALELLLRQRKRHLQGLTLTRVLVGDQRQDGLFLSLDEREVSTDGTRDRLPDLPIAVYADQSFDQTVVAENVSAAQSALGSQETLVTHRTLVRVLLVLILVHVHVCEEGSSGLVVCLPRLKLSF